MQAAKKWENLSSDEQQKYQNNEQNYIEHLNKIKLQDINRNNNIKMGSQDLNKDDENKAMTIEQMNEIEKVKYLQNGSGIQYLKQNQVVFTFDLNRLNLVKFGETDNFNKLLSKENQIRDTSEFKKTDNPDEVKKAFVAIFKDEDARISLKYLCSFSLGGKFKADRKKMNKIIQECLGKAGVQLYGSKGCGYNGLLKLAPILLSEIRKNTLKEGDHPWDLNINEKINIYCAGFESNFEYSSLKRLGCNQAALNYCYTRLILSIDLVMKKKYQGDSEQKLLKRLASFLSGYSISEYIKEKESTKRVLNLIQNLDLKGSDISFDAFGYK